jgi:hypothetical protein
MQLIRLIEARVRQPINFSSASVQLGERVLIVGER